MPFRRVEARLAGKNALGILVPQGNPTVVVVRPRSLSCDLLPARWSGNPNESPAFCHFGRDEAARAAKRFFQSLTRFLEAGIDPFESFGDGSTWQLRVREEDLLWIVCCRAPGQEYQPASFASETEVEEAANRLRNILAPIGDQEVYFNTQQFANG